MSKKRNSITINIDEYEFEIVLHNHPFHNFYNLELALEPPHIYILIRKNHALMEYWARFYQKDNRYVSKETLKKVNDYTGSELDYTTNRNIGLNDLLIEANIIELCENEICLKNDILLQLI
jgi:hypothetical protein